MQSFKRILPICALVAFLTTGCQSPESSQNSENWINVQGKLDDLTVTDECFSAIESFHERYWETSIFELDSLKFLVSQARRIKDSIGIADDALSSVLEQYCDDAEEESTVDIITSYRKNASACFFLTILKYGTLLDMKEMEKIRPLFLTELNLWQKLSNCYKDFLFNCIDVEFYSGSITYVYQASVVSDLRQKRMKDMNLLESFLYDQYDAFEEGLPNDVAVRTLVNNMSYRRSHIYDPTFVDQERLVYYNEYFNKVCSIEPEVEKLLNKWVNVRKAIAEIIDHDSAKPFREQTSILLYEMALMNHGW